MTAPTLQEINDAIIDQIEASMGITAKLLPRSFIRVLAKVLAAIFTILYKYGGFVALQLFIETASYKTTTINGRTVNPLLFWGRLFGVSDPTAATQAELLIDVTVENQTGSLPVNTQLVGPSNGVTYLTLAGVLLDAATVQVTVRASSDQQGGGGAGTVGNLDPGDELQFANPLANVARAAVVSSQTVTGADAEAWGAYRERAQDRAQKRPQGGAYADYEQWGEEVAGIINVYPYTSDTPGQVDLYCEATIASSGSADGIPTAAQLEDVLEAVNVDAAGLASRRSANAWVNVYPITRSGFDVQITGIADVDDLAQVQADITDALTAYFASIEPFIAGLSIPPRNDRITRTQVSAIAEDIVTAAGGTFTAATLYEAGGTGVLEVYSMTEGEKAKLDTLTFV